MWESSWGERKGKLLAKMRFFFFYYSGISSQVQRKDECNVNLIFLKCIFMRTAYISLFSKDESNNTIQKTKYKAEKLLSARNWNPCRLLSYHPASNNGSLIPKLPSFLDLLFLLDIRGISFCYFLIKFFLCLILLWSPPSRTSCLLCRSSFFAVLEKLSILGKMLSIFNL